MSVAFPCPKRVDCPGSDSPLMNATSEGDDLPMFDAIDFCCNGQLVWATSLSTQQDADEALQRAMATACPDCGERTAYTAEATCPDGTVLAIYTSYVSQAEADAAAAAAELALEPYCDSLDTLYSWTCTCPDGSDPITIYSLTSEAHARMLCEAIPRDCEDVYNTAQTCTVACPGGGGTYSYTVPAGVYLYETQAEADAYALAIACAFARLYLSCLGPFPPYLCDDVTITPFFITWTGPMRPTSWGVIGSLPTGLTLTSVYSGGRLRARITGKPGVSGTFTFSIWATDGFGVMIRTYTCCIVGITPEDLDDGSIGSAYSQILTVAACAGTVTLWEISDGDLPDGLTIDASTGEISGTPTTSGAFDFTIRGTTDDITCEWERTITIAGENAWWKMDEASGTRADAVGNPANDLLLLDGDPGNSTGKISNALRCFDPLSAVAFESTHGSTLPFLPGDPGITLVFWFKIASDDDPTVTLAFILGAGLPPFAKPRFEVRLTSTYIDCQFYGMGATYSKAEILCDGDSWPIGEWMFVAVQFRTADLLARIAMNNGAWSADSTDVSFVGAVTTTTYMRGSISLGAADGILIDEMGLWPNTVLTDAQITYIYNAGAGRTWPIVFP